MNRFNRRTALRLGGVCVLMLGFSYALVPLYDAFCDLTGLSGSTSNLTVPAAQAEVPASQPAQDRTVTLQFVVSTNHSMPWDIRPDQFEMVVQPGQTYQTVFHAYNRTAQPMVGQAVPSVTPTMAAPHLVKQECFCFNEQPLAAGERVAMPLVFRVSERLPEKIDTLTLSYTFFDITRSGTQSG